MILTRDVTKINLKWFLACLVCLIAFPFFIAKVVIQIRFRKDPDPGTTSSFMELLGVYEGMPVYDILVDLLVGLIFIVIIFVYHSHKTQAIKRKQIVRIQEYQTATKLQHPAFARSFPTMFLITYIFNLVDTFVMPTIPQLLNLIILVSIMVLWGKIQN